MRERGDGSVGIAPGTVLGGRYRIERLLGRGGMGAVYEATYLELSRRVALKVLDATDDTSDDAITATEREARAAAQLAHPHIVPVTDFFRGHGESPFLVMELLHGESLAERLARVHALPPDAAAFVAVQVLSALAAAHEAGLVHRDVKPANVFLTRTAATNDFVRLLDFGVAWNTDVAVSRRGQATAGTPAYMSPEQVSGEAIDARADLWAVGVCLFEMLTGELPFAAPNAAALLVRICQEPPPPLEEVAPGVGRELARIVARALTKDPSRRFESAEAMRAALAPFARAVAAPSRALGAESAGDAASALAAAETVRVGGPDATTSSAGGAPPVDLPRRPKVDAAPSAATKATASPTLASRPGPSAPPPRRWRRLALALALLVAGGSFAATIALRRMALRGGAVAGVASSAPAGGRTCRMVATFDLGTLGGDQIDLAAENDDAVVTIDEAAGPPRVFRRSPSGQTLDRWTPTALEGELLGGGKRMRSCVGIGVDGELALAAVEPQEGRSMFFLLELTPLEGALGLPLGGTIAPFRHLSTRIRCARFGPRTALVSLGDDSAGDSEREPDVLRLVVFAGGKPENRPFSLGGVIDFDVAVGADAIALATVTKARLGIAIATLPALTFTTGFYADDAEPGASIAHVGDGFYVVWRQKPSRTSWARVDRAGSLASRGELPAKGEIELPAIASNGSGVLLAFGRREGATVRIYVGAGGTPSEAAAQALPLATAEHPTQLRVASGASPWLAWVDDAAGARNVRAAAIACP